MHKISYKGIPQVSTHTQSFWFVSYNGVVLPVTSRGGLNQELNGRNNIEHAQHVPGTSVHCTVILINVAIEYVKSHAG